MGRPNKELTSTP